MSQPTRILVVEDESSIAETLLYTLKTEGFLVQRAATLEQARSELSKQAHDLIILDVGLPDGSGFEFCKEIRKTSPIPILFLTARSDEVDKIVGLEIGGDDYVTKPFSPREVSARVKAIFRRLSGGSQPPAEDNSPAMVVIGPFCLDEDKKRITIDDKPLSLSRYEYRLLKVLLEKPGRVYSRDQLMQMVWDAPDMSMDRTVDAHIKTLRRKIKQLTHKEDYIVTHRGMGYSLREED